jgi:HK97 family phage prohead protease
LGTNGFLCPNPPKTTANCGKLTSRQSGAGEGRFAVGIGFPASPRAFSRHACHAEGRGFESLHPLHRTQGLSGIVGNALQLREERDGLYGAFKLHKTSDGDKALHLVKEGLLSGLSLEATALHSACSEGRVQRLKARLSAVALCRSPAFQDARVLAVRGRGSGAGGSYRRNERCPSHWRVISCPHRVFLRPTPTDLRRFLSSISHRGTIWRRCR